MRNKYPDLLGKNVAEYFDKRIRSAAELRRFIPYKQASLGDLEQELKSNPAESGACIYIHIPFCSRSCSYCGYYKCVNPDNDTVKAYIAQLKKQMLEFSKQFWVINNEFRAVYFGGGTPSLLPSGDFVEILNILVSNINLSTDCEISFESTISDLDSKYIKKLGNSSVNRISLGIQSFDNEVRNANSRISGYDKIKYTIDNLRSAGINNICADLMYGIKGQSFASWQYDLEQIRELGLDGASIYPLIPFPGSPMVIDNNYQPMDPNDEYKYFSIADKSLLSIPDWQCYTPVQYGHSRTGNARYVEYQADNADILAIGPSAGGKINGIQYLNTYSVMDFIQCKSFPDCKMKFFIIEHDQKGLIRKLNFFRQSRENEERYEKIFSDDPAFRKFLQDYSFIRNEDGVIEITETGRYWSANLASLLLQGYVS